MGIDWTWDRKAIAEAIPPAYTEHVGSALLWHVTPRWACSGCGAPLTLNAGEGDCCGATAVRLAEVAR